MTTYVEEYVKERIDKINKRLYEIRDFYTDGIAVDLRGIESGDHYRAMEHDELLSIVESGVDQIGELKTGVDKIDAAIRKVGRYGESLSRQVNDLVGTRRT